jgi:DNA-directed RNA polymerase II subunit RPB2
MSSIIESPVIEKDFSDLEDNITQEVKKLRKSATFENDAVSWFIIDKFFKTNNNILVKHHLDSYNDFIKNGIPRIFRQNNPIINIKEKIPETNEYKYETKLFLGGKDGSKIYFGKPIIYDEPTETSLERKHYMYPNEARLRNMTYGCSIHFDVDVDFKIIKDDGKIEEKSITIEKMYLGNIPIMLHSDLCILNGLNSEVRYNLGECKNDYGGYFIIDGKEKVIVSQEKFANNMLNIKDSVNDKYSHSADIRTASEDPSKPVRTLSVRIVAKTPSSNNFNNIVVNIPNVRLPVPLFILMRALGVISDKEIIQHCLLDMEKNSNYIDLFIPSVYDAGIVYTQEQALQYIATLTKHKTVSSVMHILMDYFLPHIGELNFKQKAYYLGYMVFRLLKVFMKDELPTDRDSFKYKRVDLPGTLLYDLFLEYYKMQLKQIRLDIDNKYYYHEDRYSSDFYSLIELNYDEYFSKRITEEGIRKAFKGNWGAQAHTKKMGVVQDLNRLSYFSAISQLRKINLYMDSSAKVVKPRLLHSTQWGLICPVDTPDGGNIGFHKHMSITAQITSGCSGQPIIKWFHKNGMKPIQELQPRYISQYTKVFVNGAWVGVINNPQSIIQKYKLYRRNGLIPVYNSIHWNIQRNEILINTDGGRIVRPIFYKNNSNSISYKNKKFFDLMKESKGTWNDFIIGTSERKIDYSLKTEKIYEPNELYNITDEDATPFLNKNSGIIEYLDTQETEGTMISISHKPKDKYTTHFEIHPSLILGVMGNMIVYPENNQLPRDLFSCGQSKQGVSLYHSNYHNRIDKMGVILNNGQIPIIKSRYFDYVTNEQHPYGENAIVAIMSYNGYNVEDALIFNEGSLKRGLFRTTYFNMYETYEESSKKGGVISDTKVTNITNLDVTNLKPAYDYNHLDENGLIKENTYMDDKKIVIGKATTSLLQPGKYVDNSITPKKGQLGYVDKVFITDDEEGFRIAKVRIREDRVPAIGDKFSSRAGQKGTVGIVLPEKDMPFTESGIKPDIIVNPHALPSRMTIGQLVECLMGKACVLQGGFGDCTAFVNNGPKHKLFGNILTKNGFHNSGCEILMNGMTGEQVVSDIFIGPTYYMRLKHMVKDKINYRARGPRTQLTRQTVGGRANDGGLRIGEMERDGLIAHGISKFIQDSMMTRGDEYYMAICNNTGTIAVYNESKNIFLSPHADGPIKFNKSLDGNMNVEQISKFGRNFSIVKVPYSFKLLMQELQTMNIQMRIITEDNVEMLDPLSYNSSILKKQTGYDNYEDIINAYKDIDSDIQHTGIDKLLNKKSDSDTPVYQGVSPPQPGSPAYQPESPAYQGVTPPQPTSPAYQGVTPPQPTSPAYQGVSPPQQGSPAYQGVSPPQPTSPAYQGVSPPQPTSPAYQGVSPPQPTSPAYQPTSPAYQPVTPAEPGSPPESLPMPYEPITPPQQPTTPIYQGGNIQTPLNKKETSLLMNYDEPEEKEQIEKSNNNETDNENNNETDKVNNDENNNDIIDFSHIQIKKI